MKVATLAGTLAALVTALGIVVGAVVSVSTLTRGERARRRLKTNAEILGLLSEGSADSARIQALIEADTVLLHELQFPTPDSQYRKWSRLERLGGVSALVLGIAFIVDDRHSSRFITLITILAALNFFFLAYTVTRQQRAQKELRNTQPKAHFKKMK